MRLILNNFLSYGDNVVVDISPGVTLIRGDNGVGKSGLLEAFTYAIWGKARGTSEFPGGDHLIRDSNRNMSVELGLSSSNQVKITRGRDDLATNLSINLCGADQQFVTLDGGEKIINNIVGMGYDTFVKTAYFQQGKDKAFSELTSTESRKKVVEMLGLDRWQEKQAIASKKLDEIKKQITKYKIIMDSIDNKVLTAEIEQATTETKDTQNKINIAGLELEITKNMLTSARFNASALSDKISAISAQVALEEEKRKALTIVKLEIEDYSQKMWNLRKQLKVNVDRGIAININMKALQEQIDRVDIGVIVELQERDRVTLISHRNVLLNKKDALRDMTNQISTMEKQRDNLTTCGMECPVLGTKCEMLGQDRLQERVKKINEDIAYMTIDMLSLGEDINKLQLKISIYEANINKYENIKTDYATNVSKLDGLALERKGIDELITSTKSNVDNINTLMQNTNIKYASVSTELEQIKTGMITVVNLRQEYTKVNADVSTLEKELKGREDDIKKLNNTIASDEAKIKINTGKLKEFDKFSSLCDGCINEQHIYDILTIAFGPNGVPAMQIEAMKDQIEVLANNILQYGGQKLSVSILLKEPKKSGDGVKDVFKILVKTGDRVIPLFRLSGGEAYWVDLSVRAALFLVWRVRNPDNILDILMIDEGLGKIDDGKRRILVDVLKYLSTKVKRVLVITHTDLKNLVDEFDNVITVSKIDGVSTV